jgi:hypothetical protein
MFNWKRQLEVGTNGEHLFLQGYPKPLIVSANLSYDFLRVEDGAKIELKTDTYSLSSTPNFFLERWSKEGENKPGGPWRARRNRIDIFIYYFIQDGTFFEFTDVKKLCARADKLLGKAREVRVKNKGYYTIGYPIPREAFSDLYTIGYIGGSHDRGSESDAEVQGTTK